MIEVRKVQYKRGYTLALWFNDGTRGDADLEPELYGALEPLRDKRRFRHAFVQDGTVHWMDGKLDLAPERLYALVHQLPLPKTGEQAIANEREVSLRELRKLAGISQSALAEDIGIEQSELSRFERRKDPRMSTMRRYVEAMGGKFEVTATIGDKRLVIRG